MCGASRRALAPPSSSNPQPRHNSGAKVGSEEPPDRGSSSPARTPHGAPSHMKPPSAASMRGGPAPPPRAPVPPTTRRVKRAHGPGPYRRHCWKDDRSTSGTYDAVSVTAAPSETKTKAGGTRFTRALLRRDGHPKSRANLFPVQCERARMPSERISKKLAHES